MKEQGCKDLKNRYLVMTVDGDGKVLSPEKGRDAIQVFDLNWEEKLW